MKGAVSMVWKVGLLAVVLQLLLHALSVPRDVGILSQGVLLLQRILIGSTTRPVSASQEHIDQARWAMDMVEQLIDYPVGMASVQQVNEVYNNYSIQGAIYTPKTMQNGEEQSPVLIFFHGGGMVIGSARSSDRLCRRLADMTGFIVFNVNYPLAPEHKFPEPYEASLAALEWAIKHAYTWGGDADRIVLIGESAGGTLAAAIGANAPKDIIGHIRGTLLLYPALLPVTPTRLTPSQFKYREYLLSLDNMILYWHLYLRTPSDELDPRAAPLRATDAQLSQTPPTVLLLATQDVLRDEGVLYLQRLEAVGVATELMEYQNTVHCFFGRVPFTHGRQALQDAVGKLQRLADRV